MNKRVTIITQQTLFDIAIQQYGGVDGILLLIEDNPQLALDFNSNIFAGMELKLRDSAAVNEDVSDYYLKKELMVATLSGGEIPILQPAVSNDFNCDYSSDYPNGFCEIITLGQFSNAFSNAFNI